MGVIAKYKFDQTIYENLIPAFNSGFTDYTITDEIDTDGFTIRTIDNNSGALPTTMRFGTTDGVTVAKQKCLLDVISLDGNNINDMGNMFRGCQNLKSVGMSNVTSKVTGMNNLFRNCSSLTILNISNLDTSQVTSMSYMFYGCSSLTFLDTSNFNTSQVTDMNNMFNNCSSLTSLNVSNFNTEKVTSMSNMFQGCSSLTSLDLSNFNTEKVTSMSNMFQGCSSLISLDVSNFNTEKVSSMGYMFYNCSKLTSLDVSSFNTSQVTNMSNMFQGCSFLTSLNVSSFNTSQVTDMNSMFYSCSSLTSLDVSNFNTSQVTNMSHMFRSCSSLTSLDVSNFNTSKVTHMSNMFTSCSSLTSLDVSNFNTSKVTTMDSMFNNCNKLTSLDVSNFNIEKVSSMSAMFGSCTLLTSLDISNFNTSQVTNMNNMFYHCSSLIDIGAIYCNSYAINKISDLIATNTTIWYNDANLSDLTVKDNITYKKYQSTTLSLNEPIQLRSIGDVHDEINYETGEYIQRIGEIVLDGSESWLLNAQLPNANGYYAFYYCPSDIKLIPGFMDVNSDRFSPTKNDDMINEMNGEFVTIHGWGYGINICIKGDKLAEQNVDGFKQWLSQNPTTVQYQLAQPTTRKVNTTILDQNNNYKSFQQTYDESTYISVQSDTVVTPTSSVDYEIYSSTGTVTGTSATIDNAEAGTPVSGVVYGETLLNCVQDKGNSEVVCLGDYSGTNITIEDSIEGNIKNAVIKGDTEINLVSRITKSYFKSMGSISPTWNTTSNFNSTIMTYPTNNSLSGSLAFTVTQLLQDVYNTDLVGLNGKTFVLMATLKNGTSTPFDVYLSSSGYNNYNGTMVDSITAGQTKEIKTVFTVGGNELILGHTNISAVSPEYVSIEKILIVEKDTINFSYFEGMKSVTNPSVTVCGKNLAINKPNTTQEYGRVVFTTDGNKFTMTGKNTGYFGYDFASQEVSPQLQAHALLQSTIDFYSGKVLVNEPGTYTISSLFKTTNTSGLGGSGLHISIKVHYDDTNSIDISPSSYENGQRWLSRTFTVKKHINGIWLGLWYSGIDFSKFSVENIQLEKGSTATTYEQYRENTITCSEPISLHKIGDVQDELDLETGVLTQRTQSLLLDDSSRAGVYTYGSIPSTHLGFTYIINDLNLNCNFSQLPNCVVGYDIKFFPHSNKDLIYGYINKSLLISEDADGIKQFISNNIVELIVIPNNIVTTKLDLIALDQDSQSTTFHTYDTITHINTSSNYLKPTLEITNPTYDVILKPNTEYTIKTNRTNRATLTSDVALDVNLGGSTISMDSVTNHVKVKTPSTLENNTLTLSGFGNKVKEVMVIEGDYVDRDLDFFEGFISVENPIVQIYNDNMWGKLILPPATIESFTTNYQSYITTKKPVLFLKPNTRYIINADITTKEQIVVTLLEKTKNGTDRALCGFNITGTGRIASCFDTTNGEAYLNFYPGYNDEDIKMVFDLLEQTNFTVCEYSKYGNNINTVIEKKSNTLTTYPQVTLRSIGDIKDEWDVVGETVTRRVGKIVLDGSEEIRITNNGKNVNKIVFKEKLYYESSSGDDCNYLMCDKLRCVKYSSFAGRLYDFISIGTSGMTNYESAIFIKFNLATTVDEWKDLYSQITPITLYYQLETPITESVRITPPNPQTSTASITIPTQLNHVEDTSDFLVWNPYKEHYVRYNYVENGVVLDNYTWENLTDLNERQFVGFYNKRTYIDQPYHNYVASHDSKGTSKYVLIEPNQNYTVNVRFSELPTCETVKVNLGGAEVEMNVNDPHVHVTTPNTLVNNLCSISGDGLDGKVTDILVIHCLEHEGFADIDYFEGIDGIGEIVDNKVSIVMEQTNGNLIDMPLYVHNNGNAVAMYSSDRIKVRPSTIYRIKGGITVGSYSSYLIYFQSYKNGVLQKTENVPNYGSTITTGSETTEARIYTSNIMSNGNANVYTELELCYADMEKDYIRPRYYDKEEIILPMQLHRINTTYDNFYYDEMKGYYRIQQSIGHKYFVGADSENWTLIERGQRVLRFRYNNADIQIKSLGEFMTNRLPNGTATSPYECCAFSDSTFIVSIDKERLSSESLTAFKEWLANNNLHLYYQLASPLMIDLPEYSSRIEFNTYKDEIYTFFKNCKPTVFTLSVPLDQTYRFYELEQGEGYANRVELTDERMTEEDKLYVHTIYGSGISNLIEEPNNVDTMLKPNYEGKATSHSLINGKVSTIGVHGFEPDNVTISNYNTVTKQYELTVQAQQGTNTNTETLAVPYKLEVYEDGTKDRVYYNSQYKQWMFEGGQTLTVPYNASTGAFTNAVEVFRGLQPRSGLIGEFKVKFASGTTSARLYYSINGTTYGYTTLRGMTDEVDYYIGFFNTGGSKIDMGTKIDANAEYTTLVPINGTIPECLMINQIQSITECTYHQDKTYYYSDVVSPLLLDVYDGTTTITELNGAVIDIQNNAHNKQALIYGDTTYTVYWTYVGGEGNIKVTLGGVTQEVVATQGYVTITTSDTDLERGLFIGGFNVTIKDLMLIKGERIENLKYFEGSRAVGTAFTDEDGNTMYKITFVTGSELINDKFEDMITFEDNKKHNVVVTKLLGAKPDKN